MAISFNFNSPNNSSPVKETQCKCINCLHCHRLSKDILRCNITLNFIFSDNTIIQCKDWHRFKENKNYERIVHFSFCVLQVVDGIAKYTDTGLGLVIKTKLSDNDVLKQIRTDENIIRDSTKQIQTVFRKDIPFTPILTFEKYINKEDGDINWKYISSVLTLEEAMTCLNNLRNSG